MTQSRMNEAIQALKKTLQGLRTGRASPSLLETVVVEAYGAKTPLSQLGTVSAPEPRLLVVQVWDDSVAAAVGRAIQATVNLNPIIEGKVLRIPIPELTQERRQDLAKTLKRYGEETRVGIRTIRRQAIEDIDLSEKNKEYSEDDAHIKRKEIEKITKDTIALVDTIIAEKEAEILKV